MTITCGPSGSTGQEVADQINANTAGILALSKPLSRIYSVAPLAVQSITDTPTAIHLGDSTHNVVTGITTTVDGFTVPTTGYYEVVFNLSIESGNGEVIEFMGAVNGTENTTEYAACTGAGTTRPVSIAWHTLINLNADDVLSVKAKAVDGAADITIYSSSVIIKTL